MPTCRVKCVVRRWLAAVRADGFSLSRFGDSDRLFPFKVIWDFSRYEGFGIFLDCEGLGIFFLARLVTRSLCSCVLC